MENADSQFDYDCASSGLSSSCLAHFVKAGMPWSTGSISHGIKGSEMSLWSVCKPTEAPRNKKEGKYNDELSIVPGNSREAGKKGVGHCKTRLSEASGESESLVQCVSSVPHVTKKMRALSHIPRCQVEGCKTDLSSAKEYHRRHKVCASHSKAAKVIVRGQEQRFCQQCSRFHCLSEFDEGKRSCRRRLAGHNERRRKPPADTFALSAGFLSACQGVTDRRFGHVLSERACFLSPSISGATALWNDYCNLHNQQKETCPGLFKHDMQLSFDSPVQSTELERHLLASFSRYSDNNPSSLLPQSPKGITSAFNGMSGHEQIHQHIQGSAVSLGQGLTLTPLSGAEVLSGLEATPISQGFTKVSDTGRALSLQSTMQLWSSQAPVAVSLDSISTLHTASMLPDQCADDDTVPMAQPILHGYQHQQLDWVNEKFISSASNLSSISTSRSVFSSNPSFSHDTSGFVESRRYQALQSDASVVTDLCARAEADPACLSLAEQLMPDCLKRIPCNKQSPGRYARSEVI